MARAAERDADSVRLFDFGTESSPTWYGFARVTEKSVYDEGKGFGWVGERLERLSAVAQTKPDALAQDFVQNGRGRRGPMTFRIDVPTGKYFLWMLQANYGLGAGRALPRFHLDPYEISIGGKTVLEIHAPDPKTWLFRHEFEDFTARDEELGEDAVWTKYVEPRLVERFLDVEAADGKLEITLDGGATPVPLAALIVTPKALEKRTRREIDKLRDARRQSFRERWAVRTEFIPKDEPFTPTDAEEQAGYVVFRPHYLKLVFPFTTPAPGETGNTLEAFAARGEFEPFVFAVRPLRKMPNARLQVTDLRGSSNAVIPASKLDVRWMRYVEARPEASRNGAEYRIEPWLLVPRETYTMDPEITRQFWITVHVPDDAEPGIYAGTAILSADDVKPARVTLKLRVLPFKLHEPEKIAQGIYHLSYGYPGFEIEKVVPSLRDHGINILHLSRLDKNLKIDGGEIVEKKWTAWDETIAAYRKGGIEPLYHVTQAVASKAWDATKEPRVYPGYDGPRAHRAKKQFGKPFVELFKKIVRAVWEHGEEMGYPPLVFYCGGEGGSEGKWGIYYEGFLAKTLHGMGMPATVSLNAQMSIDHPFSSLPYLEIAQANPGLPFTEENIDRLKTPDRQFWLYNTGKNRFVSGFYLWRVGARGNVQEIARHKGDYFDPFDQDFGLYHLLWPASNGPPHPTIQYEWRREGIDDSKYIEHLQSLMARAKHAGGRAARAAAEAQKAYDELMSRIEFGAATKEELNWDGSVENVGGWAPEEHDRARWVIATHVMELERVLGSGGERR
jgi:hypothetical protein